MLLTTKACPWGQIQSNYIPGKKQTRRITHSRNYRSYLRESWPCPFKKWPPCANHTSYEHVTCILPIARFAASSSTGQLPSSWTPRSCYNRSSQNIHRLWGPQPQKRSWQNVVQNQTPPSKTSVFRNRILITQTDQTKTWSQWNLTRVWIL